MKISKKVKTAGLLIAVVLIAFVAFMVFAGSDVISGLATGSELLKPDGNATGKALVVYNSGLSGAPKNEATKIAEELKARGYEVMLAGVKSEAAANVSGYDVIVAGGPIYGGRVSSSVYSYLQALVPSASVKVGAFAIGGSTVKAFPDATWLKTTALLSPDKDIDRQRADFMAQLLNQVTA